MSGYIVTARKWRPMKFEDVVGQGHVTQTLRNALSTGRLAHAYLFSGPRGVGKTTTARLLAKAVNCLDLQGANPDNSCEQCAAVNEGRSFDVLEIDGASNRGVDEIRNLRESVRYAPQKAKYKVYIIDEVHMLTKEAFNALLKTLEEPPSHVLFIFATTEIHKVPATILSRCQRFDFRRIAVAEIVANLQAIAAQEGVTIDAEALHMIARKGDGSMRDAQSIFDQVISLCGMTVTHAQILEALNVVDQDLYFRVTDLIKARDAKGGLLLVEEVMNRGYDIKEFLGGLTEHLRNLMVAKTTGDTGLIEASEVYRKRYAEEAAAFTVTDILRFQRIVAGTETAIRWSVQPRFRLEADMVQLITLPSAPEVGAVLLEISELKKQIQSAPPHNAGPAAVNPTPGTANPSNAVQPGAGTVRPQGTGRMRPGSVQGNAARPAAPPRVTPPPAAPAARVLTDEEAASRWQEFVDEVRRQRVAVGSVLEAMSFVRVDGSTIRVCCADEFQRSTIERNRNTLSMIIQQVFNVRARLEAQVKEGGDTQDAAEGRASPGAAPPQEEHPVIKAMKRELGAEPL